MISFQEYVLFQACAGFQALGILAIERNYHDTQCPLDKYLSAFKMGNRNVVFGLRASYPWFSQWDGQPPVSPSMMYLTGQ